MYRIFFFLYIFLSVSCISKNEISVEINNTLDIDRFAEMVELDLSDLSYLKINSMDAYEIYDKLGNLLPSQLTYDGKLLFQINIEANTKNTFFIKKGEKQEYRALVFGRHYPERYGDFAWENDRVGFRFYGKELKEIQAPTSGLDLWYKRTDRLVLDDWYRKSISGEASYHEDHGEGCDPYAVGRTLGGGSMSPYIDGKLLLNDNFESFEVYDNGPLRITFKLTYPPVYINGKDLVETKLISLDAGSQLTRIVQEYSTTDAQDHFSVAAGIAKRSEGDSLLYKKGQNFMIYQEPFSEAYGQLYLGIIIPQGIEKVFIDNYDYQSPFSGQTQKLANTLASATYTSGTPIVYYTGFGWNKFGFESLEEFESYMSNFSKALSSPLKITYSK